MLHEALNNLGESGVGSLHGAIAVCVSGPRQNMDQGCDCWSDRGRRKYLACNYSRKLIEHTSCTAVVHGGV